MLEGDQQQKKNPFNSGSGAITCEVESCWAPFPWDGGGEEVWQKGVSLFSEFQVCMTFL